ncbi:hypothetical protein MLD38_002174 [Melastoma candidum]|uniref:Uncharacterized protein n=1 Tax=Melastoma candidum TaxID=119954 RepID=A0ACB9SEZ6_9MYRT|nr:hypothetical protein MLD38_002174 [Melastoma candidum]
MHHVRHSPDHPLLGSPRASPDNVPSRRLYATFTLLTVTILTFFFIHLGLYSAYVFSSSVANISISRYHISTDPVTTPSEAPSAVGRIVQEGRGATEGSVIDTTSLLLPAWEIQVVVREEGWQVDGGQLYCVFPNNVTSVAIASGVLLSMGWRTFKCGMPERARRRLPFRQPVLMKSPEKGYPATKGPPPELWRWNFLAYEAVSTDSDVVVFAKGVNRIGMQRSPSELTCVFGNDPSTAARTAGE